MSKPSDSLTADQLVALFNQTDRHPKALDHHLRTSHMDHIIRLAYGEFAERPLADVPAALAQAAYDEMERRQNAVARLRASLRMEEDR